VVLLPAQLDALHDLAAADRARVDDSERSLDRSSHLHLRALIFKFVNENVEQIRPKPKEKSGEVGSSQQRA